MQQQATIYPSQPPAQPTMILPLPKQKLAVQPKTTPSGAKGKDTMTIQLTLRDLQILEAVHTARYLETSQIEALFWRETATGKFGPQKACARRLRLLHAAGYVRRIERPVLRGKGTQTYVYALTKKSAHLLVTELGLDPSDMDWQPKSQEENYPFLAHLLATTDFRIALQKACPRVGLALEMWLDEKVLRTAGIDYVMLPGPNGELLKTAVIPDAVFMLARGDKRAIFFVEIDMGTVSVEPSLWQRKGWAKKVQAYGVYMNSAAYASRYEDRRARVLTITTSEKRLKNLKALAEKADGASLLWFSTFAQALDPSQLLTAPIWYPAGSDAPRPLIE